MNTNFAQCFTGAFPAPAKKNIDIKSYARYDAKAPAETVPSDEMRLGISSLRDFRVGQSARSRFFQVSLLSRLVRISVANVRCLEFRCADPTNRFPIRRFPAEHHRNAETYEALG